MADLYVKIVYNIDEDKYEVDTNCTDPTVLVEEWVRNQFIAGADNTKPRNDSVYTFTLACDLSYDSMSMKHDCGNEDLAAGIMLHYLQTDGGKTCG